MAGDVDQMAGGVAPAAPSPLNALRAELRGIGRPPRSVVAVTAAGLAGTVMVTLLVLTRTTQRLDEASLPWFTALDRPGPAHWLIRSVVTAGAFWLVGLVIGALALWLAVRRRRPRVAVVCGVALVGMDLFLYLVKLIVGRTAPHSGADQLLVGGASYPSGHTAHAMVGLVLLTALTADRPGPRRWAAAVTGGLVVGLTTLILGYHWLTDVVAGWCMAAVVLAPALWLLRRTPLP